MWVLVALTAQCLPTLHAITGDHEICAIHGDVVEAGHHEVGRAPPALREHAAPALEEVARVASADTEDQDHAHCDLLGVVARRPQPSSTTSVLPCLMTHAPTGVFVAAFTPPPIALGRLAPKLSPPVFG